MSHGQSSLENTTYLRRITGDSEHYVVSPSMGKLDSEDGYFFKPEVYPHLWILMNM